MAGSLWCLIALWDGTWGNCGEDSIQSRKGRVVAGARHPWLVSRRITRSCYLCFWRTSDVAAVTSDSSCAQRETSYAVISRANFLLLWRRLSHVAELIGLVWRVRGLTSTSLDSKILPGDPAIKFLFLSSHQICFHGNRTLSCHQPVIPQIFRRDSLATCVVIIRFFHFPLLRHNVSSRHRQG